MSASTPFGAQHWPASSPLPPGRLEQRERLEQLRALEAGMRIDVALVAGSPSVSILRPTSRAPGRYSPGGTDPQMTDPANTIAFQGRSGAYGDLACRTAYPDMATLPCATFEDTFTAVGEGRAAKAMIAIDNSLAGRVADVHHLMPESASTSWPSISSASCITCWRPRAPPWRASRSCTATSTPCRNAAS